MFDCSSCTEGDFEGGMSVQCSACKQSQCQECLDDQAICVPCK